jgi:hypothetical protein
MSSCDQCGREYAVRWVARKTRPGLEAREEPRAVFEGGNGEVSGCSGVCIWCLREALRTLEAEYTEWERSETE